MRGQLYTTVFLLAAAGSLAARGVVAQTTPPSPLPPPPPASTTPSPTRVAGAINLPSARASVDRARAMDASFMTRTRARGIELVELGELAAGRASNPDVRALGQQVAEDRGRAAEELRLLARTQTIALPAALDSSRKDEVNRISRLSSPALDKAIVLAMLRLHDADVADFRKQTQAGQEVELQGWVYDTLPVLEEQQVEMHRIAGEFEIAVPAAPSESSR